MKHSTSLGGLITIPGFGDLKSAFKGTVNVQDVAIGAALGLGGTALLRYAINKFAIKADGTSLVPEFVLKSFPFFGGLGTGLILWALQKKKNAGRAKAHLVSATLAGAVVVGWDMLKKKYAALSDLVMIPGYSGLIIDNPAPQIAGMIVDNPNPGLASVVASAYGEEETQGIP